LEGGQSICREAGIPVAGGHSIDSVEAIYGLVVLGLVNPKQVKRNADAKAGDLLILGKPLGVGIYAAALKKGQLADTDYAQMLQTTTSLNKAGSKLGAIDGVHAMTDVTGFGLAGHALEMARAAKLCLKLDWQKVPLLPMAKQHAGAGHVTGASARNWSAYGHELSLDSRLTAVDRALLTDPQTSGGLLVACTPQARAEVFEAFASTGLDAREIGSVTTGAPGVEVMMSEIG
jgi:selenide,water dikinase